ncbi:MAG: hypothetical protein RSA27_08890, partial [Oscillospiraceae bacterium]
MEEEKDNIHEKSVLLFSDRGIVGVSNIEITPELAVKIGVSLGSMFRDGNIALSYDSDHASEMLISAIECGLKSTGVQVFMFGEQTLPITRSGIAYYRLTGGIHLNMSKTDDMFYSKLEFIDSSQANFDTKSKETLENIYTNETFVRVEPHEIKPSINLKNFKYFYTQNIFNSLKSDIFNINLKAWTKSKTVSELLEMLLHEIENRVLESSRHVEFFAEISENGETATFFTSDSHPLSGEQFFGIMSIILLNHHPSCQIVLPVSASDELKSVVLATGGTVVQSKISDAEFMKQVLKFGTPEQFKFCFNGIYATVTLLDYLNHNALSFDALV